MGILEMGILRKGEPWLSKETFHMCLTLQCDEATYFKIM